MNIKVDFDNIVVKEDKNDFNVKVLMLKGEKGDAGDGEPNVIEKVQVNGSDLPVNNKTVNVPVPTVDSTLSSSSTNPVQNKTIYNALNNKVNNSDLNNYYEISEIDSLLNDKANNSIVDKKIYFFDNVASMKTYDLKVGDYAITKGYYSANDGGAGEYEIVDDNTLNDDGGLIFELSNELRAKLILADKGKINIKKLGAYGDNVHDDTIAFETAISICKENQINTLYIPKGIYIISNNLIIDYPLNIEGEYSQYTGAYTKEIAGTILSDNYDGNNPFIKYEYDVNDASQSRIWGVKISNVQINGNGTSDHIGLYLKRTGWSGLVSNLYIRGYYHTALFLDRVFDTKFDNISIVECGSKTSSEQNYALVVDDTSGSDTSNALHFDSVHIEASRYALKLNRSKNNTFVNCKFEDKINNNESDTTNSEIIITDLANENTFVGCQFIGIGASIWTNNNIAIENAPYMIDIQFISNRTKAILFDSCQFSSGNDRGTKYIKTNNYTQISNCSFRMCCNKYYSLDLQGANLNNSSFILNNSESGISSVSIINCRNNNLIENCKFQYFESQAITNKYALDLGTYTSSINNCQYTGFTGNYKYTNQSSINFNLSFHQKNLGMLILSDSQYKNLMGISEIDYNNIVIDVSKITNKLISLSFSRNATIKELKNGLNGEEITFINNTAYSFTFGGDFDYYGTKIRGSETASTITINNMGSCKLSKFTNYWKVISKN